MKILKQYTIEKGSILAATAQFRSERKDLQIPERDRPKLMQEFMDSYRRSEDYDLASSGIFDRLIPSLGRKTAFKSWWSSSTSSIRNIQNKMVLFNNNVYTVTDQKNGDDGVNDYKLIRYDQIEGTFGQKMTSIIVRAKDEEMKVIR